jgi:hypothetical protein
MPSGCLAVGQQNRLILKHLQMCFCVYTSRMPNLNCWLFKAGVRASALDSALADMCDE